MAVHPGPLPQEREKRSQRLGETVRRMVQGFNARMDRGNLSPGEREALFPRFRDMTALGWRWFRGSMRESQEDVFQTNFPSPLWAAHFSRILGRGF
jgi:phytoene dehydrogenase-like protein